MAASVDTLSSLQLLVMGRYLDVAGGCLFAFDYLLTLNLEIKYIWKSEWTMMKVMYLLNRFATILDFVMECVCPAITNISLCPGLMESAGVMYILGVYFAECIFAMRTHVLWERRKIVGIPLCVFYVGTLIYSFIAYYSKKQAAFFPPPPFKGCLVEFPVSLIRLSMLFLMIYDAVMIVLITWATVLRWRRDQIFQSDLLMVLYAEGILFYIYLLAFSIASYILTSVVRPTRLIHLQRNNLTDTLPLTEVGPQFVAFCVHGALSEINSGLQGYSSHPRGRSSSGKKSNIIGKHQHCLNIV